MKKFLMLMVASASVIWAGGSPFTNVRVGARDATGKPTEEIVDMAICLERIPEEGDSSIRFSKGMYERVMKLWADYFYEMSNGGVFLGNVRIYPGNLDYPACSVDWKMNNVHPNSVGNHNIGGIIHTQDNWTAIQNIDVFTTEMALVLTHESGHQVIGVKDEYGNMPEGPCGDAIFTTNPDEDYIEIDFVGQNPLNILNFTNSMKAYVPGTAVLFNADGEGVKLPDGLFAAPATNILEDGRPAYLLKKNYPIVDHVDIIKREKSIVYRLYFRTSDGEKIDIKDKGQGNWSFSLPVLGGASAHTLMNNPDMIQVAMNLGLKQIPWQWANLTTQFNLNPLSFQGLFCRDAEGTPKSAWEMVVADPQFDNENCQAPSKPRYWFKSMIGREPTEKDVYHTNSSYINYDSKTGKWQQSDATWYDANMATHTIEVDLPYMKVEIDRPEAEYAPLTRKYLNVQWINSSKTDVMVAIDWSLSMRDRNKYNQAMLALKHIAGGFMNIQDKNTQAKAKDFRLGVFLFNDGVTTLFEPTDNFTFDDVLKAIEKAPKPAGQTAMFDAIDKAISSFSNDAEASKILYVISDGRDNRSKKTKDDIVKLYESKDISIHTFSYGDDADLELLSSMAEATGGSFFEQMDSLYLKTEDAIVAVLAENPENEQVAAATVAPQAKASAILPREVSKVQIFGSFESEEASSEPLAVTTINGAAVPFSIRKFKENGRISFVAEIDSATLASLATPYVQVASKLKKSKMDYRMVASSKRMLYQMKAKATPTGPYVWPREGRIEASLRKGAEFLTDVEAVATLTYPDGTVRRFNLSDDGANGDEVADDGTYSAVLPDVNANGTYQWEVRMKKGNAAAVAAVAKNAVAARNAQVAPRTAPNAASTAAIAPRTAQAAASTAADVAGGDDVPFEFIRNGQFVVTGCCTDEPSDELLELSPNKRLHAYLQTDGDEDRFKIVATEATHSYSLYIKSLNLDAFDRVDVFAPSDLENPVYSVAVAAKAGEPFVTIPLSNEFTMPGYVVALHGMPAAVAAVAASTAASIAAVAPGAAASPAATATASPAAIATAPATASGVNYSLALLDVTSSAFTIGRFEDATDWRADSAFATLDSRRKFEGDRSLVSAGGEKLFESRAVSTDDFELVGDRLKLNAFVPASQINRNEMKRGGNRDLGNISLWCVRDGVRKQIGETQQFRYILGNWQSYEFKIPADLVKSFGEPHAEFKFQVAVNSLDSVWIDNLRFIGKLQDNPANKVEIACPGSAGCSESNPIIVPENGSVRITAKDDAWVSVNAPANENAEVVLDVTPTDGKELSGTVIIDGKTHKLSGWTWQKTSAALGKSLHRALFRNMNGRTLRFRTWQKRRGYDFAAVFSNSASAAIAPINFAEWWSVKF